MPAILEFVDADVVQPLRTRVLRPLFSPGEHLVFPEDGRPTTLHVAASINADVVGVATFLPNMTPYLDDRHAVQLRGMAVSPQMQGAGIGKCILDFALPALKQRFERADWVWCNARETAVGFYDRCGFEIVSERFDIPNVGPHFVMRRLLVENGK
ncbi:MAG: GNAT family N-acetyltransferase [bacterium]